MMLAPCNSLLNLHLLDSAQLQSAVDELQGELLATLPVLCFVTASLFLLLRVLACSRAGGDGEAWRRGSRLAALGRSYP